MLQTADLLGDLDSLVGLAGVVFLLVVRLGTSLRGEAHHFVAITVVPPVAMVPTNYLH